jgi:hypothetical protein
MLAIRLFARPDRLARTILGMKGTFEHVDYSRDLACQRRDAIVQQGEAGID